MWALIHDGFRPDVPQLEHCSFDYMKTNAEKVAPSGGALWNGGAATFINKGTNDRWRDVLTPADIAAYEKRAIEELGAECAAWPAGDEPAQAALPSAPPRTTPASL